MISPGPIFFWDAEFTYSANNGILTISYDDTVLLGKAEYTYSVESDTLTLTFNEDGSSPITYVKEYPAPDTPEDETEGDTEESSEEGDN